MDIALHTLRETIHEKNYVVGTYSIELPVEADIIKKAEALAVGQTVGTWTPIPGITEAMREKYMGKVLNIYELPPIELTTQVKGDKQMFLIQVAYPAANFGRDFPLMITSLLGNDASTSAQVKLLDIEFPETFLSNFHGPRFGSEGLRERLHVYDRPFLLNMIKPCTGITPSEGANIFYQVALGGVDIIKDDELLGNPDYSLAEKRVLEYKKAAQRAFEETGHRVHYFVNISRGVNEILDGIRKVEEAGADGIMVNFAVLGYSCLKYIAEHTVLPILAHSAGVGMFTEGSANGMVTPLAVGKLTRIAGADIVMINTPYGGYPLRKQKYLQTLQQLTLPLKHIKASLPSLGGGVHPGIVEKYIHEAGKDIVLAAGGAIQGHSMGPTAGAKAMRKAIEIAAAGRPFLEAAQESEELKLALERWGYIP